jgi:hypothetical protein
LGRALSVCPAIASRCARASSSSTTMPPP